jgi:hypothetical protein
MKNISQLFILVALLGYQHTEARRIPSSTQAPLSTTTQQLSPDYSQNSQEVPLPTTIQQLSADYTQNQDTINFFPRLIRDLKWIAGSTHSSLVDKNPSERQKIINLVLDISQGTLTGLMLRALWPVITQYSHLSPEELESLLKKAAVYLVVANPGILKSGYDGLKSLAQGVAQGGRNLVQKLGQLTVSNFWPFGFGGNKKQETSEIKSLENNSFDSQKDLLTNHNDQSMKVFDEDDQKSMAEALIERKNREDRQKENEELSVINQEIPQEKPPLKSQEENQRGNEELSVINQEIPQERPPLKSQEENQRGGEELPMIDQENLQGASMENFKEDRKEEIRQQMGNGIHELLTVARELENFKVGALKSKEYAGNIAKLKQDIGDFIQRVGSIEDLRHLVQQYGSSVDGATTAKGLKDTIKKVKNELNQMKKNQI